MMNLDQDFVMELTAVGYDTCSVIVIIVNVVVIAVDLIGGGNWVICGAWHAVVCFKISCFTSLCQLMNIFLKIPVEQDLLNWR